MDKKKLNKEAHIKQIEESLSNLQNLSAEFAEPAPTQLQLLGTAVDNTTGGLASALNSISDNPKVVRFGHDLNWMSYMGSVHRSFFTSLLAVTEEGLKETCLARNIEVQVSRRIRMESILNTIRNITPRQKKKLLSFAGSKPEFMDYLEAVTVNLAAERKIHWKTWFAALLVIRNVSSHSNSLLSESEKERLTNAGFEKLINGDVLSMNTSIYYYCLVHVRDFYAEIQVDRSS